MVTLIGNNLRGPVNCPKCGGSDLVVSTKGSPLPPGRPFYRRTVEFIGYDCRACGEALRFNNIGMVTDDRR